MKRNIRVKNPKKLDKILIETKDKSEDFKALTLKLVNNLSSITEVAKLIGVDDSTISLWLEKWNSGKIDLKSQRGKGGGRKKLLTEEQQKILIEDLKQREALTTLEIKEFIKNKFNIEYSDWHICCLMRKLGMNFGKPYQEDFRKPINAEELLDIQLQLTLELLNKREIKNIAIGMIDETAPQTTANTVRMWSFGKITKRKNTDKIKSNTAGFYALKGNSISISMQNGKATEICKFLEIIKNANSDYEAIIIILDNTPSHRSLLVRQKAKELDIYLVYLPPYSPQLNPIEYIWKSVKRVISTTFIESQEFMSNLINKTFSELSKSLSFADYWIKRFLPNSILLSV